MSYEDVLRPVSDFERKLVPELGRTMTLIDIARHNDRQARLATLPPLYCYGDESGTFKSTNAFAYGMVFARDPVRARRDMAAIRQTHARRFRTDKELKFSGSDKARVEPAKDVIDYFFENPDLRYGVIVVTKDQQSLRYFSDNSLDLPASERAYIYYADELLQKRTREQPGHANYLFIDERPQSVSSGVIPQMSWWGWEVREAFLCDSVDYPLIQLADLLTGVVAASYNGKPSWEGQQMQAHVHSRLGVQDFSRNRWDKKFNVWRFRAPADHLVAA